MTCPLGVQSYLLVMFHIIKISSVVSEGNGILQIELRGGGSSYGRQDLTR